MFSTHRNQYYKARAFLGFLQKRNAFNKTFHKLSTYISQNITIHRKKILKLYSINPKTEFTTNIRPEFRANLVFEFILLKNGVGFHRYHIRKLAIR